jgi:hypothetical protein
LELSLNLASHAVALFLSAACPSETTLYISTNRDIPLRLHILPEAVYLVVTVVPPSFWFSWSSRSSTCSLHFSMLLSRRRIAKASSDTVTQFLSSPLRTLQLEIPTFTSRHIMHNIFRHPEKCILYAFPGFVIWLMAHQ